MSRPGRAVVVVFERLDAPEAGGAEQSPWDPVELRSLAFENFLSQDCRAAATVSDVLGGETAVQRLLEKWRSAGRTISLIDLVESAEVVSPTRFTAALSSGSSTKIRRDQLKDSVADLRTVASWDADLVWVCVSAAVTDADAEAVTDADAEADAEAVTDAAAVTAASIASEIVDLVRRLTRECGLHAASDDDLLIVTGIRGSEWSVSAPFSAGHSDAVCRVPLWLEMSSGEMQRVQTVCGSLDVIPTLERLLSPVSEPGCDAATGARQDGHEQFQEQPVSLIDLARSPHPSVERLVRLQGDGWTGCRTQSFLYVRELPGTQSPGFAAEDQEQLFRKPEDVWNLNDVCAAYSSVAGELNRRSF